MTTHADLLASLLPLAGRLVHFELHVDMSREAPAAVIAIGILSTAETNMPGVPEGERVLVKVGDARAVITCAAVRAIDSVHGPDCPCFGVVAPPVLYVFMDAGAHLPP